MRVGLQAVVSSEPGLRFMGGSDGSEETIWPLMQRARPDVVLLDYHLPRGDGMQICYRIKSDAPAPRVVIFSAYASAQLALAAAIAGADALLTKGIGAAELVEGIRRVHRGGDGARRGDIGMMLHDAARRLAPEDLALVSMLLDGASEVEIAGTRACEPRQVRDAVHRILARLRIDVPDGR
jgi:DNA-binding NarL/FixJ family response regulator